MQKPDVPLHRRSTRSVIRKTSQPNKPTLDQLLQLKKPQEKFIAACSDNDLFTVEQLLESYKPHLDPDRIRDSKLRTPLMLACMKGHTEIIKVLLRWGADVNNPMGDIVGNRPLHMAIASNNFDAVLVLLEAGAKIRPEESETFVSDDGLPSAIREKNLSTAPLDLATSKLNALMKQVNTRNRAHSMGQVLKIIDLLKHYSSGKENVDLDELTKKISGMRIEPGKKIVGEDVDFLVMKNLKDVIEKMKIA